MHHWVPNLEARPKSGSTPWTHQLPVTALRRWLENAANSLLDAPELCFSSFMSWPHGLFVGQLSTLFWTTPRWNGEMGTLHLMFTLLWKVWRYSLAELQYLDKLGHSLADFFWVSLLRHIHAYAVNKGSNSRIMMLHHSALYTKLRKIKYRFWADLIQYYLILKHHLWLLHSVLIYTKRFWITQLCLGSKEGRPLA